MSELQPFKLPALRELPRELRLFAGLIMLVLSIGYAHAIGYVYLTTHMIPKGIEERYRGTEPAPGSTASADSALAQLPSSEEAEMQSSSTSTVKTAPKAEPTVTGEMQYQKSLPEMLNLIHTHILTMTFIFALSGFITLMTRSLPRRLRSFAVIEPFIGIVATFAGIWATRYLHPAFSWVTSISGALMAFAFAVQCLAVINELLAVRKHAASAGNLRH